MKTLFPDRASTKLDIPPPFALPDASAAFEEEDPAEEEARETEPFVNSLSKIPKLNPTYTFSTFVRGPSNQFALATCQNVAENPGTSYNPLFLYGSTGLGKTHLLHAVGNMVASRHREAIVTYISSERFMNEMIYCIRHNKMWDFRQKYRHCDVFLMDDIQFISGNKSATQEEFFHTFNTLYESKKQIIITSDLFPQDIPDLEERLRNRFQWGLIADIQPPDVEHRIAILINKAEQMGVVLSYEIAEFIAINAKRNIRELEGALHRIVAFSALHGRPLDKRLAVETFESLLEDPPKKINIELIQKVVAQHFKIRITDLKSKKRLRILTVPRQIAMYLSRECTNASFPDIGEKFGGKDHTTVMHAFKKVSAEKESSAIIKNHLDILRRTLQECS
jgi:chromosomal replication initiator protein